MIKQKKIISMVLGLSMIVSFLPLKLPGFTAVAQAPTDVNLALGKTVECKALKQDNTDAIYPVSMSESAVDGDEKTLFEVTKFAYPDKDGVYFTFTIDFGKIECFNKIVLKEPSNKITSYKFQYSDDKITWQDIKGSIDSLSDTSSRYLRLSIDGVNQDSKLGISEIEVYKVKPDVKPDVIQGDNLAKGKIATGFALDENEKNVIDSEHKSENAVDGNASTFFGVSETANVPITLTIDLGDVVCSNAIVLKEPSKKITSYRFQCSDDGVKWKDIEYNGILANVNNKVESVAAAEVHTDELINIYSRYLRLRVEAMDSAVSGPLKISEIEVYYLDQTSSAVPGLYELNETQQKEALQTTLNYAATLYDETDKDSGYIFDARKELGLAIEHGKIVKNNPNATIDEFCRAISRITCITKKIHQNMTYKPEYFDEMAKSMVDKFLGAHSDLSDPDVKENIEARRHKAQNNWDTMDMNPSRTALWKGKKGLHYPQYTNLRAMALAYAQEGNPLKGNSDLLKAIIDGLEFLCTNEFNEDTIQRGNHYEWDYGSPLTLTEIIAILGDNLSQELKEKYLKAVYHFISPTYGEYVTGGNRADIAKMEAEYGVVAKDGSAIMHARESLYKELQYKTGTPDGRWKIYNDGIYPDGSMIQHFNLAYNASYGNVYLSSMVNAINLLMDTRWEIPLSAVNMLFRLVYDGFEPFIYKGASMDMVRGRSITRESDNHDNGTLLIGSISKIANLVPEPFASDYAAMVKKWVLEDRTSAIDSNGDIKALLKNPEFSDVLPAEELIKHKRYSMQDRVVHLRPGFGFGLSMISSRIRNYERTNRENMKGWYTGSGMTYLYNNDLNQYADGYWYTADMYRLPGITINTRPIVLKPDPNPKKKDPNEYVGTQVSQHDWVGGTSIDDLYGVTGMELGQFDAEKPATDAELDENGDKVRHYLSLTAKKSWFMFDNEIVALGAGITSTDESPIETIVDNRKISTAGNNAFTVNGKAELPSLGTSGTPTDVKWAHIAGNEPGSDVGYYFPTTTSLNTLREARTGNPTEVQANAKNENMTRNYLTLWFDHGKNPVNKTYDYVLLPNKSSEDVKAYAENPSITILENSPEAQAVKNTKLNIIGVNFWNDVDKKVDIIKSNKKASVMTHQREHDIEISVSDPTMKNSGTVELEIDKKGYYVVSADPGVTVTQVSPTIKLSVDVKGTRGQSLTAKVVTDTNLVGQKQLFEKLGNSIALYVDSNKAVVKGSLVVIDEANLNVKTINKDGDILVPARFVAENSGARVSWNEATSTMQVIGKNFVQIKSGEKNMRINRKDVTMKTPAQNINGTLMVSLISMEQALGETLYTTPPIPLTPSTGGGSYNYPASSPAQVVAPVVTPIVTESKGKTTVVVYIPAITQIMTTMEKTTAQAEMKIDIEITDKAIATNPVEIKTELPTADIKSAIKNSLTNKIEIKLIVPNAIATNKNLSITEIKANKSIFQQAKESGKVVVFIIETADGKLIASWSFDATKITNTTDDVNLAFNLVKASSLPKIKAAGADENTIPLVVSFNHSGNLPASAKIILDVSAYYNNGEKLFLYYFNETTKKLELISKGNKVLDGKVAIAISHCSDYVLTKTAVKTTTVSKITNVPKTGDTTPIYASLVLIVLAGALIIARKKFCK